jgi:hypothetical protein
MVESLVFHGNQLPSLLHLTTYSFVQSTGGYANEPQIPFMNLISLRSTPDK